MVGAVCAQPATGSYQAAVRCWAAATKRAHTCCRLLLLPGAAEPAGGRRRDCSRACRQHSGQGPLVVSSSLYQIQGSEAWCRAVQCVLLSSLGSPPALGPTAQRASARLRPAEPGPRCNTPRYDITGQRSRVAHSAPSQQPSQQPSREPPAPLRQHRPSALRYPAVTPFRHSHHVGPVGRCAPG